MNALLQLSTYIALRISDILLTAQNEERSKVGRLHNGVIIDDVL